MEINNLPDTEFTTLVIRKLHELRGRINEFSENIDKDIGKHKKELVSIKNTVTEITNTLESTPD